MLGYWLKIDDTWGKVAPLSHKNVKNGVAFVENMLWISR